jgi:hypothetical protein
MLIQQITSPESSKGKIFRETLHLHCDGSMHRMCSFPVPQRQTQGVRFTIERWH